jgi:hypothetical protein
MKEEAALVRAAASPCLLDGCEWNEYPETFPA